MDNDPLCNATKRDLCAPVVRTSRLTVGTVRPRPVEFDAGVAGEVLTRIAGGAGLKTACVDPLMPHWRTFRRWCDERPDLRAQYRAAQAERAAALADEVLAIADEVDDPARVGIARLRTDSRRWLAGKLDPARWGDRIEVEQHTDVTVRLSPLETARRLAFLLAAGAEGLALPAGLTAPDTLAHDPAPKAPGLSVLDAESPPKSPRLLGGDAGASPPTDSEPDP